MVRLLACSFIWVLLIRPTVVKFNTPAEIKIMIIECIKSPWQGVFFECVLEIRYWLTCRVVLQSKHCTSTQLKVLSPVCSCRLFNCPRWFKITQTGPAVMPTEIASDNSWPFFSFLFNPLQMKHVGVKAGKTSWACSEQTRPGVFNCSSVFYITNVFLDALV